MDTRETQSVRNKSFQRRPSGSAPRFERFDRKRLPTQSAPARRREPPVKKALPREQPKIEITNDLQVTDGKHRGVQLQNTASPKILPTARQIRESLFQVLGKRTKFARFLDLCAGSGMVGIEAISRGALLGTFVERSARMCHFIKLNLKAAKINLGHGEIFQIEAVPFLKRMAERKRSWDIIYYNPPYDTDYDEALTLFARGACLRKDGGVLIIEHHAEMFFPPALGVLRRRKVAREGDTALTFYERQP